MTKKFKKLTAMVVLLVTTMSPAMVRADNLVLNPKTGMYYEKGSMLEVIDYVSTPNGAKTVNVIIKDGVSMVKIKELAEVAGLNYLDLDEDITIKSYMDEVWYDYNYISMYKNPTIPGRIYSSYVNGHSDTYDTIEGPKKFKTSIQQINGEWYAPAREIIELVCGVNDPELVFDAKAKTITFQKKYSWMYQTSTFVPR